MDWPGYHEHPILSGESAGLVLGHSHGTFRAGHQHRRVHNYPARADGGFYADYGPANSGKPVTVGLDGEVHLLPATVRADVEELLAPYIVVARRV